MKAIGLVWAFDEYVNDVLLPVA